MWRKTGLMGCILGLALVAGTATDSSAGMMDIDTTISWNPNTEGPFSPFGFGGAFAETVGQTFLVTEDTILDDFTFWVNAGNGSDITASAFVYGWSNTLVRATDMYYSSLSTTINHNTGLTPLPFLTGGVSLAPGQYVAFLSASAMAGVSPGTVGARATNVPPSDSEGFFLDGTNWTSSPWTATAAAMSLPDLAFKANFSDPPLPTIPEPSSLVIFSLGCACVALLRTRRPRVSSHA